MTRLRKRKNNFLVFFSSFIGFLLILFLSFQISTIVICETQKYYKPAYSKSDISEILKKKELSKEDYFTIFAQTGLTIEGVNRFLELENGEELIIKTQENYFKEFETSSYYAAPLCANRYLNYHIQLAPLKTGDIIVSPTSIFAGFPMGHAALVTDGEQNEVIEAVGFGLNSRINTSYFFENRPIVVICSPKVSTEIKERVVYDAKEELLDQVYNVTVGVLTDKYCTSFSQCSQMVWKAYKKYDVDLDADKGGVVTPMSLTKGSIVDIVQIYGLDPLEYKDYLIQEYGVKNIESIL